MLSWLAHLVYRFRHLILGTWLLSLCLFSWLLWQQPQEIVRSPLTGATGTEAYRVERSLEADFDLNPDLSLALILEGQRKISELKARLLKAFPAIRSFERVRSQQAHRHQLYYLTFDPKVSLPEAQKWVPKMRQMLKDWQSETGQRGYVSGSIGFMYDTNTAAHNESELIEKIALVLAFLILIFNFGSLLSSLLPIFMGATSLLYLAMLTRWLELKMTPITLVLNSMVCLALAIDYSLFMVSRFNEENKRGRSPEEALKTTFRHAGETIFFSALVMICSVSVLLIPEVSSAHILVQSLALVIALSLGVSLLILPTVLLAGRHWLNWPKVLTQAIGRVDKYAFWKAFSKRVVKHPRLYFSLSLLALLLLAAPMLKIQLWEPILTVTPHHADSYRGYLALKDDGWGGEILPIDVVVRVPVQEQANQSITSPKALAYLHQLTAATQKMPHVASVMGLTSWQPHFSLAEYQGFYRSMAALRSLGALVPKQPTDRLMGPQHHETLMLVYPDRQLDVRDTYSIIEELRSYAHAHPEFQVEVGGIVARNRDFTIEIYRHLPLMLAGILLSIFAILFLYMRAVVLPLKAALMNFLPIFGAYGVLVLVFQYGWGQHWLGLSQQGGITALVPVVLFCIVFGLSMDYEVLILSRISEAYRDGLSVYDAVVEGLARSGAVITGAALILLGVFVPGLFAGSPLVKEIALGLTIAILLDATLLRLFLVPSFMLLMGKWNWWNPLATKAPPLTVDLPTEEQSPALD